MGHCLRQLTIFYLTYCQTDECGLGSVTSCPVELMRIEVRVKFIDTRKSPGYQTGQYVADKHIFCKTIHRSPKQTYVNFQDKNLSEIYFCIIHGANLILSTLEFWYDSTLAATPWSSAKVTWARFKLFGNALNWYPWKASIKSSASWWELKLTKA